jgi:hypothetical protein
MALQDVIPMTPCFRRTGRLAFLSALTLGLCSCGSVLTQGTADLAGVGGAGIASAVTSNGAVTAAIGLGVQSVASSSLAFVERRVHRAEQDRVAAAAGPLPVGAVAPWRVSHDIPIENDEHGEVTVSRLISSGDLDCKEIVFSVDHPRKVGMQRAFYVSAVCRDGQNWKWATAEPATARWGSLQ